MQVLEFCNSIMKKKILLLLWILFAHRAIGQSDAPGSYLGINLAPIFMTQIDLHYERLLRPNITGQISGGFVINAPYGSFYKINTEIQLTRRMGPFLRIGMKVHPKVKKFYPFVGGEIINSLSIERGSSPCPDSLFCTHALENFSVTSYNLGVAGIVGLGIKPIKRLKIDLGIRIGMLVINGLADYHSFAPGMGINWDPVRAQFLAEIKYALKK